MLTKFSILSEEMLAAHKVFFSCVGSVPHFIKWANLLAIKHFSKSDILTERGRNF